MIAIETEDVVNIVSGGSVKETPINLKFIKSRLESQIAFRKANFDFLSSPAAAYATTKTLLREKHLSES